MEVNARGVGGSRAGWEDVVHKNRRAKGASKKSYGVSPHGVQCKWCRGVKVESKCFDVSFEPFGGWITERRQVKTAIKVSWEELEWVGKQLIDAATGRFGANQHVKQGGRKISLAIETNRRGSYARLDCTEKNRIGKIMVPQGDNSRGWLEVGDLILSEVLRREVLKLKKSELISSTSVQEKEAADYPRAWEVNLVEKFKDWTCGSGVDLVSILSQMTGAGQKDGLHLWWSAEIWEGQPSLRVVPAKIGRWDDWPPMLMAKEPEKKNSLGDVSKDAPPRVADLGESSAVEVVLADKSDFGLPSLRDEGRSVASTEPMASKNEVKTSDTSCGSVSGRGDESGLGLVDRGAAETTAEIDDFRPQIALEEDMHAVFGSEEDNRVDLNHVGEYIDGRESVDDTWESNEHIPNTWQSCIPISDTCSTNDVSMGNMGFLTFHSKDQGACEEPSLTLDKKDSPIFVGLGGTSSDQVGMSGDRCGTDDDMRLACGTIRETFGSNFKSESFIGCTAVLQSNCSESKEVSNISKTVVFSAKPGQRQQAQSGEVSGSMDRVVRRSREMLNHKTHRSTRSKSGGSSKSVSGTGERKVTRLSHSRLVLPGNRFLSILPLLNQRKTFVYARKKKRTPQCMTVLKTGGSNVEEVGLQGDRKRKRRSVGDAVQPEGETSKVFAEANTLSGTKLGDEKQADVGSDNSRVGDVGSQHHILSLQGIDGSTTELEQVDADAGNEGRSKGNTVEALLAAEQEGRKDIGRCKLNLVSKDGGKGFYSEGELREGEDDVSRHVASCRRVSRGFTEGVLRSLNALEEDSLCEVNSIIHEAMNASVEGVGLPEMRQEPKVQRKKNDRMGEEDERCCPVVDAFVSSLATLVD